MYLGKNEKERSKFIASTESGVYTGETESGEYCRMHLEKGQGMIVKIQREGKEEWFECIEYDKDGYQISVFYEPFTPRRKEDKRD